ncbi:MAG: ABC transporter permease [Bacilli bacterium]|nr:ABC transporter permease [Bacilli bacterium]
MYILKNAYTNIIRAKGRNILLGIIVMAITIGACIAITINKSGNAIVSSYKENNPLEVSLSLDTMSYRDATDEEKEAFNLIDIDTINSIGNLDLVTGYYYTLQSSLNSNQIEAVSYDDLFAKPSQTTESSDTQTNTETTNRPSGGNMMESSGDYTLLAYSDISYNEDFINGDRKILEGTMIDKDNTDNVIVISEELATNNNLEVGDSITFVNTNDETITYELKIVGIYEIVNENFDIGMGRNMTSSSNQIYTNITVLNNILSDNGEMSDYEMSSSISSAFYIEYEDLDQLTEKIRELGVSEYYSITTNEDEITETLSPIKNIASFSFTFLIIILIVGAVVLTIINLFNIRERKYEIGVLRAIGMNKMKVTLQLVIEIFIIAFISLIIGTGIGTLCAQPVSNYMLAQEIENYTEEQSNISNNFGGEGFTRPGFNNSSSTNTDTTNTQDNKIKPQTTTTNYVSNLEVHTDITTILQLFGVSLLLTIISGTVAVMFVNKYEPNKILQNRG